jgi:hypothetical protein
VSRVVFSLTEQQVAVLAKVDRGEHVPYQESRTVNVLRHRGLLEHRGRDFNWLLTPLGKAAVTLATLLATPEGH